MSHKIESMMYNARKTPWHGLGVKVQGKANANEVLQLAGLDWEVELQDLYTQVNGKFEVLESHRSVMRLSDSSVLGVVGSRYTPLQNKDAFTFFDPIVDRDEAVYETAGSINGGRKVWLLAKLPDHITVGSEEDVIEKYVLLTNSFDGSSPLIVKLTPVRVVCNNTLSFALKGTGDQVSIRHTTNITSSLAEAHKALGITNKIYGELSDIFGAMYKKQLNTDDMFTYVKTVLGHKHTPFEELSTRTVNVMYDVERLINEGAGADLPGVRGSAYGLYNAFTEYVDHEKNYRSTTDTMDAKIFGSGATMKQVAFKEALKLIS